MAIVKKTLNINLKHNLYLLFLQHLSIQKSFKCTICGMTDKQVFFPNLMNLQKNLFLFQKYVWNPVHLAFPSEIYCIHKETKAPVYCKHTAFLQNTSFEGEGKNEEKQRFKNILPRYL